MRVAAIIPAAGVGVRMQSQIPKPYLKLAGKPILAHTLEVFEAVKEVKEVTVVAHPDDLEYCREEVIAPQGFKKVLRLVPGGKERQDSVYHALKALQQEDDLDIILVHDGVRPFITPDQIRRVIKAARSHGGAILGLPAQDTLKRVNPQGKVIHTLDRKDIWQIQTPQGFQADLLWRAFVEAYSRNFYGTDEASLLEEMGQPVAVIPGDPWNLKITTPDDLELAEALLPWLRSRKT
ncbi:MAG: 2-C-methyl-D-erythritol 4-phosphate cytidylyltransferase [Deltaproteobacteria bacterium]|nr:2-C-methyl-D-erythritol 4-phosphate cytidylyltransferase [Deltaproteobacteria bacterium]MBI4796229.1 2-C-methyl-D-erythritol 4-phosphate cytidylyltransferase [Deltaproteobacteria bacterium]